MVSRLWLRFAWRRLFAERVRTILVTVSIALTTALVLAVLYASEINIRSFGQVNGIDGESYPITIRGQGEALPFEEAGELLHILGETFEVLAQAQIAGEINGRPINVVGVLQLDAKAAANIAEVSNAAVMSEATLGTLGLSAGDLVRISISGKIGNFVTRVADSSRVGVVPEGTVLVSAANLGFLAKPGWSVLFLRPKLPVDSRDTISKLQTVRQPGLPPLVVETSRDRIERGVELLGAFRLNIFIMLGLTLLVGSVLIFNTSQLSLLRARREIAILRTLGCSRGYCAWLLVSESLCVSVIGAAVGISLGRPLTQGMVSTLIESARSVYHAPNSFTELGIGDQLRVHIVAIVLTVAIAVVGALHAAWRAWQSLPFDGQSIDAGEARGGDTFSGTFEQKWVATALTGFSIAGFVALLAAPTLLTAYFAAAVLVGVIFAAAFYLLRAITGLLCRRSSGISSVALQTALRALRSDTTRQCVSVASLALSIALITALGILVSSFRGTIEGWTTARLRAGFFLGDRNFQGDLEYFHIPEQVISTVRNLPGIKGVARYAQVEQVIEGQRLVIAGADVELNRSSGAYRIKRECSNSGQTVLVSEAALRQKIITGCDTPVRIKGRDYPVGAIISEFSTQLPLIVMNFELFKELFPSVGTRSAAVYEDPGADRLVVRNLLEKTVEGSLVTVIEQGTLRSYILQVFDETFLITKGIRGVLAVLALSTVVVAVWQGVWERKRELCFATVLGMSGRQIRHSIIFETILVALVSMPVGMSGGILLALILISYINPLSFGWSLDYFWTYFDVVAPVSALVIGCALVMWIVSFWVPSILQNGFEAHEE